MSWATLCEVGLAGIAEEAISSDNKEEETVSAAEAEDRRGLYRVVVQTEGGDHRCWRRRRSE